MDRRRLERPGRPAPLAGLAALLTVLGGCSRAQEAPPERPNVVLISLDTLRADHLSCYGYRRPTSPRIDALAEEGVRFAETWSTTSWTLPAHLSMLTGLSISAHGVCDDRLWQVVAADGGPDELPLRGTLLPEVLGERGYATGGFYTWKYLEPRFGFGRGWDVYERAGHSVFSHPEWSARFAELRAAGATDELRAWMEESPELFDESRPTAGEATDRALAWLDETHAADPDRPFFLFLHLFDVHDGYTPPEEFDRFGAPGYDGPIDGRNVTAPDSPVHPGMAPRDLERLVSLYDGEIAWVDSQVGRVVDRLDELGLADDTLIVVTSDHGEEFFEHGGKTHRANLHVESLHVPLVMRWPAGLPAGEVVDGPTGLVDLVPTVCALARVPAPECVSGRDLSAVARGDATNAETDYLGELFVFPPDGARPDHHVGVRGPGRFELQRRGPAGTSTLGFDRAGGDAAELRGSELDPEDRAVFEVRLGLLRTGAREVRGCAPAVPLDAVPLSASEIAELAALGYSGTDAGTARGGADRLCLDGCVWTE